MKCWAVTSMGLRPASQNRTPTSHACSPCLPQQVRESEKSLDMRCNEIHDLYALIDEYEIAVPAMDRAAYATLDSTYNNLKTTMEEVEGAKEENVSKYSSALESGGWWPAVLHCMSRGCVGCGSKVGWPEGITM